MPLDGHGVGGAAGVPAVLVVQLAADDLAVVHLNRPRSLADVPVRLEVRAGLRVCTTVGVGGLVHRDGRARRPAGPHAVGALHELFLRAG